MDHFDIKSALNTMTIIVDTREKPTIWARRRYKQFGVPYTQAALPFGDYTAQCTLPSGEVFSLANKCHIERKMSLAELSGNFFQNRERFEREFGKAADIGAKIYLLVEGGSIDKIYAGDYQTKVSPSAYSATFFAWLARYNVQILFCSSSTSGKVIHDVLYRELKERLKNMEVPDVERLDKTT